LLVGLLAGFLYARLGAALPADVRAGFEDAGVVDVPPPTALDFAPDGRMFVASKPGQLYAHADGGLT
jgi:hypothetical protein